MKSISEPVARRHAIAIHARITRHRTPHCVARAKGLFPTVECSNVLDCAHIIPKAGRLSAAAVACDLSNAWTLCKAHHMLTENDPHLWLELVLATCGTGHVQTLTAAALEADEEGMPIYGDDTGDLVIARANKLHFWRSELHRMIRVARSEPRFCWGTTPLWVQRLP